MHAVLLAVTSMHILVHFISIATQQQHGMNPLRLNEAIRVLLAPVFNRLDIRNKLREMGGKGREGTVLNPFQ